MLTLRRHGFVKAALLGLIALPATLLLSLNAGGQPPASTPPAATPPVADPADTIRKMEKERQKDAPPAPAPPPAATTNRPADPAADAPTTGTRLIRENTFITQRRGRMTRSLTNEWVFTFDADAKGKSEPAMVLMPCMNLQNMEKIVDRSGEGTAFTLSGTVYVYKGRNYLLPSMFIVTRRGELAPAQ